MSGLCCPTCGQSLAGGMPIEGLADVPLSKQQHRIVDELVRNYPHAVDTHRLIESVWWDDPNGGPEAALKNIHVRICQIRRAIKPYGWTIPRNTAGSGHYGRYRLERLP